MTRPSTQQAFEDAKALVDRGSTVKDACKKVGLSWPTYYELRKKQGTTNPNGTVTPSIDNELPRLRKLCQAQTTLLASVGLRVEVV